MQYVLADYPIRDEQVEAKRLRKETGDHRWRSALDVEDEGVKAILRRTVIKPFIIILEEPMLLVMSIYSTSL